MSIVNKVIGKLFGDKATKDRKALSPYVDKTNAEFDKLGSLSNDQLRAKTLEFKSRIAAFIQDEENQVKKLRGDITAGAEMDVREKEDLYNQIQKLEVTIKEKIEKILEELLPEAFAVVKETGRRFKENTTVEVTATDFDRDLAIQKPNIRIDGNRALWANKWNAAGTEVTWDMVHYDVQIIGGTVLHQGKIAEMTTGEGKTLVGTLPMYLNALPGKGVHVVTVNDYLARRDSEWMATLFEFHGLRVDCIDKHKPNSEERKKAYLADITYGTNNEFGFDYLRDNMVRVPEEMVQRGHNYAIVDEVDSVLVDDARTPLIISGPTPKGENQEFLQFKPKVDKLVAEQRKFINLQLAEAKKLITGTGATKDEKKGGELLFRAYRGLPKNSAIIKFLSEQGMKVLLQKTENHYLQDQQKEMHKIDQDLLFVIDEKNNTVDLTDKGVEFLSTDVDDPGFFVLPELATELANIEQQPISKEEKLVLKDNLLRDFSIKSERIHTINQLLKSYALFERDVDYVVMDGKVKIVDEQTGRILDGRRYSDGLHQAIEAKENVKVEAATQTYATVTLQNYFRMYNKLAGMTGTAETEAKELWDIYKLDVVVIPTNKPVIRQDLNDLVYKTKREKYNATIEQIEKYVNEGRPVLVGTTSVEISELLSRMLTMKKVKHQVLNAKLHQKEADIVAEAGKAGTVTIATNMAGRGTDIKLGPGVREAGGLAIIGTERHESRRVDRQLRGRSGRQGDPGSSQFFVSLEDDLMRLFGSERLGRWMDTLGLKEGEVISHSMITNSIGKAQIRVEENNFGTRKRLLEYDDVMNKQREAIYKRRRNALFGDLLSIDIEHMIRDLAENVVMQFTEQRDFENFEIELYKTFSMESPVTEDEFMNKQEGEIIELVVARAEEIYKTRMNQVAQTAFPVIKNVYTTQGQQYENIVVPVTDGLRATQVVVNLKKAYESEGKELVHTIEKSINLSLIDNGWKEHLREMDDLKQSVQNAVYEQKDPLLIYKQESFQMFQAFINEVNKDIVSFLMKAAIPSENVQQAPVQQQNQQPKLQTSRSETTNNNPQNQDTREKPKPQPIKVDDKIGRNDPCPCGSGKKYKNCHGSGVIA